MSILKRLLRPLTNQIEAERKAWRELRIPVPKETPTLTSACLRCGGTNFVSIGNMLMCERCGLYYKDGRPVVPLEANAGPAPTYVRAGFVNGTPALIEYDSEGNQIASRPATSRELQPGGVFKAPRI